MADGKHAGALGAVYDAKRPEDVAALYDGWAETYDAEMAVAGYRHPTICLALLSRHLPRGATPLLDAGAGTGLIGEWLKIMGYPEIEALDISEGMLRVAATKKVYSKLHALALGGTLPFNDEAFAGIVSAGVFTTGHVGADALPELIRICRKDGVIVLTIKNTLWLGGFEQKLIELEEGGTIVRVEETLPYVSMPGEKDTVPSRAVVLRKLDRAQRRQAAT